MKTVSVRDAVGSALCHDLTRIVRGEFKGARFKKGHIVREEDIPALLEMGKENLFVWEKQEGFLHEDDAAQRLEGLCRGKNISAKGPSEGKIELFAEIDGLFRVDRPRLDKINEIDGLIVSTIHDFSPVKKGGLLAGTKAVPLLVEESKLNLARSFSAEPLMEVLPYKLKSAALIVTGSEVAKDLIKDTFSPVVAGKLAAFGINIIYQKSTSDNIQENSALIEEAAAAGPGIIICTGGMSVDPDDGTPAAIRMSAERLGGAVVSYGAPVLPGAMFMLAYSGKGAPIVGLPGCVMFANVTIFDILLPRLAAGHRLSRSEITALGHGGLCAAGKGCAAYSDGNCRFPDCGFGRG